MIGYIKKLVWERYGKFYTVHHNIYLLSAWHIAWWLTWRMNMTSLHDVSHDMYFTLFSMSVNPTQFTMTYTVCHHETCHDISLCHHDISSCVVTNYILPHLSHGGKVTVQLYNSGILTPGVFVTRKIQIAMARFLALGLFTCFYCFCHLN